MCVRTEYPKQFCTGTNACLEILDDGYERAWQRRLKHIPNRRQSLPITVGEYCLIQLQIRSSQCSHGNLGRMQRIVIGIAQVFGLALYPCDSALKRFEYVSGRIHVSLSLQ